MLLQYNFWLKLSIWPLLRATVKFSIAGGRSFRDGPANRSDDGVIPVLMCHRLPQARPGRSVLAVRTTSALDDAMSIGALAHICLKTADLAATEKFYTEHLGFEKQFRFTRRGEVIGFYLRIADRVFLEAFSAEAPPPSDPSHNLSHFCLDTDDLSGLRATLVGAGFDPTPIVTGADATLQFWVTDPNGVAIEVQEYTGESAQFRHDDVEVDW